MARKHNRKGISQPVERILITPEKRERKILTNPETNQLEVVYIVTPAVYKQGKAKGQTTNDRKPRPMMSGKKGGK